MRGEHTLDRRGAHIAVSLMACQSWVTVCARRSSCWACDAYTSDESRRRCAYCHGPRWRFDPTQEDRGVYILSSRCGLWKIGVARKGVPERINEPFMVDEHVWEDARCLGLV